MDFKEILSGLKIKADIIKVETNGTITKVFLRLHAGAKVNRIENCATEIALGAQSYGKPIIKIIPEQGLVVIELLNHQIQKVDFSDFDPWFQFKLIDEYGTLPIILGKTHDGNELITDLSQMPHLLIAGSTGSGKSVLLHSIICSLIKSDSLVKLALIDPKQVELSVYKDVKQLLYPVVNVPEEALDMLNDLIGEMEDRFVLFNEHSVNNIKAYNELCGPISPIVLIIDEFADLQRSFKEKFQSHICTLAQQARAAGIHLILATQRPSVDIVTGTIKANFSSRICLKVSSATDSRVVLDSNGAEKLLGRGDAIINSNDLDMIRFQSAFVDNKYIEKLVQEFKRKKKGLGFFEWRREK